MRFVFLLVTLLVTSLLVMKSLPGPGPDPASSPAAGQLSDPVQKARDVNRVVIDSASRQREALQQQLEQ